MNFHEVQFPSRLSLGAVGGPERRTEIVSLASGFEERNSPWEASRRRYDAGLAVQTLDDISELIAFFEARQSKLYGFRWKDWSDYKSCLPSHQISSVDQILGEGDAAQVDFQLLKKYESGPNTITRHITKPKDGSVLIAISGSSATEGVDFVVNYTTGIVTLSNAPSNGEVVSAGYEFDVPARFDTDRLEVNLMSFNAGEVPSVPVVELRV